ncbi:MAG: type II toxin-antitoxin system VapC family toxin [Saprospiraceae bacterium]|nr:type II toxin-antitoxin system VapC family toxin [Saprospiraceae bacterium]
MGLNNLQLKLQGFSRIALDTAPIIYFVEANPSYSALVNVVFQEIDKGTLHAITSTITLTEVLVHPFEKQLSILQQQYTDLLLHSHHLTTISLDTTVAIRAAELRAKYKSNQLRTPDAIQLAVALQEGCQAFLTNDKRLQVVKELEIMVLDDYLAA